MTSISSILNNKPDQLTIDEFENRYFEEAHQWVISENSQSFETVENITRKCFHSLKARFPSRRYWQEKELWKEFRKIVCQQLYKIQKRMDKNFGLSEANFNVMLKELKEGNDALFEKIFLNHFQSCQIYLQRKYSASSEDAFDASMHTLLEFHDLLKAGKLAYGNLRFLFTKMATQVYLKWIKKENKTSSIEEIDLPEPHDELDDESYMVLELAWEKLHDNCRDLLKKFYYDGITLSQIAEDNGRSSSALRKQKQRCIEKLRELFINNS